MNKWTSNVKDLITEQCPQKWQSVGTTVRLLGGSFWKAYKGKVKIFNGDFPRFFTTKKFKYGLEGLNDSGLALAPHWCVLGGTRLLCVRVSVLTTVCKQASLIDMYMCYTIVLYLLPFLSLNLYCTVGLLQWFVCVFIQWTQIWHSVLHTQSLPHFKFCLFFVLNCFVLLHT